MHRLSNLPLGIVLAVVAATGLPALPVAAHHSVAAYDRAHPITVTGTVQRFRFMNPHVRINLLVADGKGGERSWELVGGTLAAVARDGVNAHTLQAGQKVTLLVAPRKHGDRADDGEWQRVVEIDGRPFKPVK